MWDDPIPDDLPAKHRDAAGSFCLIPLHLSIETHTKFQHVNWLKPTPRWDHPVLTKAPSATNFLRNTCPPTYCTT
jgi:hypothetical protein